ncbi:MAG: peptide chain release factor 2 [Myxococcota bacterium]|nr:peptide chain release factor 2 [Myxococcota bacterium]
MFELQKEQLQELRNRLESLRGHLDVPALEARLSELEDLVASPDLWNDNERAQGLLKERTDLQGRVQSVEKPSAALDDAEVLIELGESEGDLTVVEEIDGILSDVTTRLDDLEFQRMLGGPYDRNDAILTINAGAGGTESLDWAGMLLRMYLRFCDAQGWSASFLDRQDGDEAGIKSASLAVSGPFAYGMLRAEAGVHRLVRISPFDASARRHTSFAACFVYPDVEDLIEIDINEADLRVDTYRASGAGGQHVNKTNSAVRITHMPSGIVVQSQSQRSQHQNRAAAMKVLKARLHELERASREEERSAMESAKQDIAFGSQIRNYVLHPYRLVKDVRTTHETSNVDGVLDGDLEPFVKAFLIANPSDPK